MLIKNCKLTCNPQYAFHGLQSGFTLYGLDFARSLKTPIAILFVNEETLRVTVLSLTGRLSRIRDKQKKKKNEEKEKELPIVGFEPGSHRCKTNALPIRLPKPVLVGCTKT